MVCLSRSYLFKFFKDCLPQNLLSPLLNTLFHLFLNNWYCNERSYLPQSQPQFVLKLFRSSCPEVFCKTYVLKIFAKFTWKHVCWSLFSVELEPFRPACFRTGAFLWPMPIFKKYLFWGTFTNSCFLLYLFGVLSASLFLNFFSKH